MTKVVGQLTVGRPKGKLSVGLPSGSVEGGGLYVAPSAPSNAYVAEDGVTFYVAEDGSTYYVQES